MGVTITDRKHVPFAVQIDVITLPKQSTFSVSRSFCKQQVFWLLYDWLNMILESLEGKIVINDCVLFYGNSLVNTFNEDIWYTRKLLT